MDLDKYRQYRFRNLSHSLVIGLVMILLLGLPSYLVAGNLGVILSLLSCALIYVCQSFLPLHQIMRLHGGIRINPHYEPDLYNMIYHLAQRANLNHIPELYYIPKPHLNAFATESQNKSAIALTRGILDSLNHDELEGVLAHEISHIKNYDTKVMRLADITTYLTSSMTNVGLFLALISFPFMILGIGFISLSSLLFIFIAPSLNFLLQLALSRTREFAADLDAIRLTGKPHSLASALNKLESGHRFRWRDLYRLRLPQKTQHHILSTHPATEERIERILSLSPVKPSSTLSHKHIFNRDFPQVKIRPRLHRPRHVFTIRF